MEPLRRQALELWGHWQALSLARKMTWFIGVVGCATLAGLLWWAAQPEYRVLYTDLSGEEAGAITSKLQAKGISYKLGGGGSTILVPADQVMQVHLDMTTEGTAGNAKIGKGFGVFDQPMLSATPFNQRVNLLRARQEELARTIMQLDQVLFARVHISLPDSSPFLREQKPATASVVVKLRPGATLNRHAVNAIAALVSGGIEGLSRESVRIVDTNSRLLSAERDPETGMVGNFMEMRRDVESQLAKDAERMLEQVLGAGKAIVRVRAELDTKLIKKKEEKFSPEGRIAKSEKTLSTKQTNGATGKGGAAGSASNLGKAGSGPGAGSNSTSSTESLESNFVYPNTVIEWQNKLGAVERLTVAAFIDSAALKNSNPVITQEDVKDQIKNAVGYKEGRDEIKVTLVSMPVAVTESIEDDSASNSRLQTILTIVRNVSIGAIALCVLPIVWMLFRRRVKAAGATAESPQSLRIADELDRNPEALAKILSHWMSKSEASDRKAA